MKFVQGKPAFTDDMEMRGMLVAKVLHSPIAHAFIRQIDASKARALPGVAAVLTYQDLPKGRVFNCRAIGSHPWAFGFFSFGPKVRFVGDRVAFVAAETEEIANQALS